MAVVVAISVLMGMIKACQMVVTVMVKRIKETKRTVHFVERLITSPQKDRME